MRTRGRQKHGSEQMVESRLRGLISEIYRINFGSNSVESLDYGIFVMYKIDICSKEVPLTMTTTSNKSDDVRQHEV